MDAQTPTALAPTNAMVQAAESNTLDQLAHFLTNNFRPLPTTTSTPINIPAFTSELEPHPDQQFVSNSIFNLKNGFDIGYNGPQFAYSASNLSSANSHPRVLTNCIITELHAEHMVGTFSSLPFPIFHTSTPLPLEPFQKRTRLPSA